MTARKKAAPAKKRSPSRRSSSSPPKGDESSTGDVIIDAARRVAEVVALSVDCPTCRAPAGRACERADGKETPHAQRETVAALKAAWGLFGVLRGRR